MSTLNVSLPPALKKIVDQRVEEGRFASHSEYVRSLIRDDQERAERESLEAKLLTRLHEKSTPMKPADFDAIRARLKTRVRGRGKSKR